MSPGTPEPYAPAFVRRARDNRDAAGCEAWLGTLPPDVRGIVLECSARHGVPVDAIRRGARYRKAVRCRDEVHYSLRRLRPRPSVEQIAAWMDRRPESLVFSIGRHAIRARRGGGRSR